MNVQTLLIVGVAGVAVLLLASAAPAAVIDAAADAAQTGGENIGEAAGRIAIGGVTGYVKGAYASGQELSGELFGNFGHAPKRTQVDAPTRVARRALDGNALNPSEILILEQGLAESKRDGLTVSASLFRRALATQGIVRP